MSRYGAICADGALLVLLPILWVLLGIILIASVPFFVLGLIKRGTVWLFTHGDPLVP